MITAVASANRIWRSEPRDKRKKPTAAVTMPATVNGESTSSRSTTPSTAAPTAPPPRAMGYDTEKSPVLYARTSNIE